MVFFFPEVHRDIERFSDVPLELRAVLNQIEDLEFLKQLSEDDYFVIEIPFKRFKEVLPNLRTAIQALREVYNSGIRFKTHLKRGYGRFDWVHHQDL